MFIWIVLIFKQFYKMHYQLTLIILLDVLRLRLIIPVNSQSFHFCDSVIFPQFKFTQTDNCTLICGLHFEQHTNMRRIKEIALCVEDRQTPFICQGNNDCYEQYSGSYCKQTNCFCENFHEKNKSRAKPVINTLNICVIQSTSLETRSVFPWKTVLAVCGALGVVALLFVGLRWIYPMMQDMNCPNHRSEWQEPPREGSFYSAYPSVPRETSLPTQQRNYNHSDNTLDDKPPAYETIQFLKNFSC
ncbi:uncharacterized protein [Centruroides vittatus]|uniref:uncharacterized protein isoform X2 n=1 Tax=Centruroides vittatus TaxID=120091 RepID=UPI00350F6326